MLSAIVFAFDAVLSLAQILRPNRHWLVHHQITCAKIRDNKYGKLRDDSIIVCIAIIYNNSRQHRVQWLIVCVVENKFALW